MLFVINELNELCKPIVKFLKENYDTHTTIIISQEGVKMIQDEIGIPMNEEDE